MNAVNLYHRPIVVNGNNHRALKDREVKTMAENALIEALKGEKEGSEGYVVEIYKVEKVKEAENET
jgi:hypothetical protein